MKRFTILLWLLLAACAQAERIDVTTKGVVPGLKQTEKQAIEDSTDALEAAVIAAKPGDELWFPMKYGLVNGVMKQLTYRTDRKIVIAKELFTITGDGVAIGSSTGTIIVGNFAGPIFEFADGGTYKVRGIGFHNAPVGGVGLDFLGTNQGSSVEGCSFSDCAVGTIIRNAKSTRYIQNYHRNCGLAASIHGHTRIENFQAIACKEGLWVSHYGVSGDQFRFEVNGTALRIGHEWNDTPAGKKDPASSLTLSSLTFEANDTSIIYGGGSNNTVSNASIYGTTNAPSGRSQVGIDITDGGKGVEWKQISVHGAFAVGGLIARTEKRSDPLTGQHVFNLMTVTNKIAGVDEPDFAWMVEYFTGPQVKAIKRLVPSDMPNSFFEKSNQ